MDEFVKAMGMQKDMEFQRLHGMGDLLYKAAGKVIPDMGQVRTYAPVGAHEDLLRDCEAYRRLFAHWGGEEGA